MHKSHFPMQVCAKEGTCHFLTQFFCKFHIETMLNRLSASEPYWMDQNSLPKARPNPQVTQWISCVHGLRAVNPKGQQYHLPRGVTWCYVNSWALGKDLERPPHPTPIMQYTIHSTAVFLGVRGAIGYLGNPLQIDRQPLILNRLISV